MGIHGSNYTISKKVDSNAIKDAIEAYNCFEPYKKDVENYARASAFVPENCEDEVILKCYHLYVARLIFIVKKNHGKREEDYFNAEQNAITAKDCRTILFYHD